MNRARSASALAMAALAAIIVPSSLHAQVTFDRTYGGGADDGALAVVQTADGGYFIVGYSYSYGAGGSDAYVIATDQDGEELWTQTFGDTADDCGCGVAMFTDGGVLAAGWLVSAGQSDVALHANMANGDQRWIQVYGGAQNDLAYSVARNSDGGFIVAGETYSFGAGTPNVYVLRIDSLGDTLWTRTYGGPYEDYARSAHQTADSGFIICGTTSSYGAGLADVWLIKTDAHGDTMWTRTYGGTHTDNGWAVQQTADNGYIMAGSTNSFGSVSSDVYVVKTDSNGDTMWTRTFGGEGGDVGCSVQQTGDSGYIIAGSYGTGGFNECLIRTDRDGDTLWTRTFGGANDDHGYAVEQTSDGGYVLAGRTRSYGAGGDDIWLIKTDAQGYVAITEPKTNVTIRREFSIACDPNPTSGMTTIRLCPSAIRSLPLTLRMYDSQGRMVLSRKVSTSSFPLSTSALPSGAYFIRCDAAGEHASTRVVLQR